MLFKNILRRALAWVMRPASPAGLGGWAAATPGGGFDPQQAGAGECRKYRKNKKVWFILFPPVGYSRAKPNFAISFLSRGLSKRTYRKNEKYPTNLISQKPTKTKKVMHFLVKKTLDNPERA